MKNKLLFLFIPVLLNSCVFYKPAKVNSPMLQAKGDGHLSATTGLGTSINASYSPINNIVIIGNYYTAFDETVYEIDPTTGKETELFSYDSDQFEIGAGYYNPNLVGNMYFDVIGGYGFGKAGTALALGFFNFDVAGYEAKFHNFFLQTTIGTNLTNDCIWGFGGKVNFLNFYDYSATDNLAGISENTYFTVNSKVVFQPFMTFRYSPGLIGLETYMGFGIAKNDDFFTHRNFDLGIGLHLDISKLNSFIRSRR